MPEPTTYDLFISYADADRSWVEGYLLDALAQAGVHWCSERAFALGVPRIKEFENAIQRSYRTLLVISPAYLADGFNLFVDWLGQSYRLDSQTWTVIPLILQSVQLPPRLSALVKLDATDPEQWEAAIARLCADLQHAIPTVSAKPTCPYPGMVPYSEADGDLFFGRDQEIEELLEKLRLQRFITVIGPSGSGKSSLVFAGLIPALHQTGLFGVSGWKICSMRPGETPLTQLKTLLNSDLSNPAHALSQALVTQPDVKRLLLIVDQFEEVFTLGSTEVIPFQQTLLTLTAIPELYLILTVRADFYADLMTSPLWHKIQTNRVEVAPLDEVGLRQAILKPAENAGVFVEPALLERLVTDAAGEPGVLPLVQETLVLLWERVERRFLPLRAYEALVLTRKAYGVTGKGHRTGLEVAIACRADAALASLETDPEKIPRRIFLRLIQFGEGRADTRRQQPVEALRTPSDDSTLFNQILDQFAQCRLLTLTSDEKEQTVRVDIAHEALISGWFTLQQWISQRREAEQTRRRLTASAEEWVRLGKTGGLLDEIELAEAERWLSSPDAIDLGCDESLSELVAASRAAIEQADREKEAQAQRELQLVRERLDQEQKATAHERKARRSAQILNVVAGISVLALTGLTAYAFIQQNRATKSEQEAQRQSVIAQAKASETFLNSNQQLEALLSGLQVAQTVSNPKWRDEVPIQVVIALQQAVYGIRERNRLEGHTDWVAGVDISPDGQTIASASTDGTIKLWKADGTLLKTIEGHTDGVLEVNFSPDSRTLVSASLDKTIRLWNVATGSLIRTIPNNTWISSVSFSPNGQLLVAACPDNTVKLWYTDGRPLKTLVGHTNKVMDARFSSTGSLILSVSEDGTARLWNPITGRVVRVIQGGSGKVYGGAFNRDGSLVALANEDNTVKLWTITGNLVKTLQGHQTSVLNLRFSQDDRLITSASKDGTITIWSREGQLLQKLQGHRDSVGSVRFSPDGKQIVSGSNDKTIRIWNLEGIPLSMLKHPNVESIQFSRDGSRLVSAGGDNTIKLWRQDGVLIRVLSGHTDRVMGAIFSPDGKTISSASADKTGRLWSVDGGNVLQTFPHRNLITSVSFSPDSSMIAMGSADKTIKLWKADGSSSKMLEGHRDRVNSVSFSPDGKLLASASSDKAIKLWNLDGKLLQTLEGHTESVLAVSFSPDGKLLASAGGTDDNTVRLWKRKGDGFEPFGNSLRGHSTGIYSLSFSPDSKTLASGSADNTIIFWSTMGALLQKLPTQQDTITSLSFSPDGRALTSAGLNGTVMIWNLDLQDLMKRGCNWIWDYLRVKQSLSESNCEVYTGVSK
jgi:WD40 repeat protein/energy-coupling factor transporter ATP-binding protein EcfA2